MSVTCPDGAVGGTVIQVAVPDASHGSIGPPIAAGVPIMPNATHGAGYLVPNANAMGRRVYNADGVLASPEVGYVEVEEVCTDTLALSRSPVLPWPSCTQQASHDSHPLSVDFLRLVRLVGCVSLWDALLAPV